MPVPSTGQLTQAETEAVERSVLLTERTYEGLPPAFQTNFIDDERLESLSKTFAAGEVVKDLNSTVLSIAEPRDARFTEKDVIDTVLDRVAAAFSFPERTIGLPGIALNRKLIYAAAKQYKKDTDTPSGTIKPPELATTDDIVFEAVTPDVYNDITGTVDQADNFIRGSLTDDQALDVIGSNGAAGGTGTLTLNDADWLFYTGDVIDFLDDASLTKWLYADVDGDSNYGPTPAIIGRRGSSLHYQLIPAFLVKETVDIDARVYDAGVNNEAEPLNIAFRFTDGGSTQPLQD